MTVWQGSFVVTRLPRINEWHGARGVIGKLGKVTARIFDSVKWKKAKKELVGQMEIVKLMGFNPQGVITTAVDAKMTVWLWKRVDTDSPIKGILDSLEKAEVVENDRLIRDISVRREYHKRDEPDLVTITLASPEERI